MGKNKQTITTLFIGGILSGLHLKLIPEKLFYITNLEHNPV